ncbi:MAG: hypothetical protein C0404_13455 [Verrucomicrobia bacterium]|nr:hypothetical protein [Verrucomicrobiota bacterium]
MNMANISYTRNHLSELLDRVRGGETILITDRRKPVARLEPARGRSGDETGWKQTMIRRGILKTAAKQLDVGKFGKMNLPASSKGGDILAALLADREEGR